MLDFLNSSSMLAFRNVKLNELSYVDFTLKTLQIYYSKWGKQ